MKSRIEIHDRDRAAVEESNRSVLAHTVTHHHVAVVLARRYEAGRPAGCDPNLVHIVKPRGSVPLPVYPAALVSVHPGDSDALI